MASTALKGDESKAATRVEGTPAVTNLREIAETVRDVTESRLPGVCANILRSGTRKTNKVK